MAGPPGAESPRARTFGRPSEDRIWHSARRLAARSPEILGVGSAGARQARPAGLVRYETGRPDLGRASWRRTQSWFLALERTDSPGVVGSMVQFPGNACNCLRMKRISLVFER